MGSGQRQLPLLRLRPRPEEVGLRRALLAAFGAGARRCRQDGDGGPAVVAKLADFDVRWNTVDDDIIYCDEKERAAAHASHRPLPGCLPQRQRKAASRKARGITPSGRGSDGDSPSGLHRPPAHARCGTHGRASLRGEKGGSVRGSWSDNVDGWRTGNGGQAAFDGSKNVGAVRLPARDRCP